MIQVLQTKSLLSTVLDQVAYALFSELFGLEKLQLENLATVEPREDWRHWTGMFAPRENHEMYKVYGAAMRCLGYRGKTVVKDF